MTTVWPNSPNINLTERTLRFAKSLSQWKVEGRLLRTSSRDYGLFPCFRVCGLTEEAIWRDLHRSPGPPHSETEPQEALAKPLLSVLDVLVPTVPGDRATHHR